MVHVQRGDRVTELPQRVPKAGGVGSTRDEAEHVATGRDQVVSADLLLDAAAKLDLVHDAIFACAARAPTPRTTPPSAPPRRRPRSAAAGGSRVDGVARPRFEVLDRLFEVAG